MHDEQDRAGETAHAGRAQAVPSVPQTEFAKVIAKALAKRWMALTPSHREAEATKIEA